MEIELTSDEIQDIMSNSETVEGRSLGSLMPSFGLGKIRHNGDPHEAAALTDEWHSEQADKYRGEF